jgi:ferredoxin like protein
MTLEDKLFTVVFHADSLSHLGVTDTQRCQTCSNRACVRACPAGCWSYETAEEKIHVAYEGCLECGTCRLVCPLQNVTWRYPRGGFGVAYQRG